MTASRPARAVAEAALLLCLPVAALHFDPWTRRLFEADKIALVSCLIWWAAGALLLGALARRQAWSGLPSWRSPIALAVVLTVAAALVSQLFAIDPASALSGSYTRVEGTVTRLTMLAAFALTALVAGRPSARERLLETIVLVTIPLCVVALLQAARVDISQLPSYRTGRVGATIGSALFLAAFLAPITPLTVRRAKVAWTAGARPAAFGYALVLLLQLTTLAATGSRGPFLALIGGAAFAAFLWAALSGRRGVLVAAFAVPALALLVLWQLRPAHDGARPEQGAARLLHTLDIQHGSTASRLAIWDDFAGLIDRDEPLVDVEGARDVFAPLRPWVGFGPESQLLLMPRFHGADLSGLNDPRSTSDRAHDEVWDTLATGGLLGLLALLALWLALLTRGLDALGLTPGRSGRRLAVAGGVSGAVLGACLAAVLFGRGLAGPGTGLGMVGGLMVAVATTLPKGPSAAGGRDAWLVGSLVVALIIHWLELQVGVPFVGSRLLMVLLAGALVAATAAPSGEGARREDADSDEPRSGAARAGGPDLPVLVWALAGCLLVAGFGTVSLPAPPRDYR